jgi:hypothetical protein
MSSHESKSAVPDAFEAWDETAAYVDATFTRAQAITRARDASWRLADGYGHRDLRARRVWMRAIDGQEAEEFFDGDFDTGWVEVSHRPLNAAQRANLTPMWKVEPR